MADRSGGGAEFFAGLVIGGLVGAALALLLAPQSGEETRAQIRDKSLEYKGIVGNNNFFTFQKYLELVWLKKEF